MNASNREAGDGAISALLYLQGVLPALSEYSRWQEGGRVGCGVHFLGPDGLRGSWPGAGEDRAGCLVIRFPRHRDIVGLFERGRGWFFPVGGWHRLGLLLDFRRTGKAFEGAVRDGEPRKELVQIQLNLLLRLAVLLYGADSELRRRVGALPERPIELVMGEAAFEEPAAGWVCGRPGEGLEWGVGEAVEPVAGRLVVEDSKVIRDVFGGTLIGEEAVNRGTVRMSGNIPAIQALNLVFEAVEGRVEPI